MNHFDKITSSADAQSREIDAKSDVPTTSSLNSSSANTPQRIKAAVQMLLKYGLLEADRRPDLYRSAMSHSQEIEQILEPLDLALELDDVRGLALLVVADSDFADDGEDVSAADHWSHPLVRRQRLTTEQSLLLAMLRQRYAMHEKENGVGAPGAVVALEDLLPQLNLFLGESGSDIGDDKRLRNLLSNLEAHGVVSEVDDEEQATIRPIITRLANPETLEGLLEHFTQLAAGKPGQPRQPDVGPAPEEEA